MHGRLLVALLALSLLSPATASAAVDPGRDIRKLEAFTSSAGALVRVTLRAPLDGRISVRFTRRDGARGTSRRSTVIRGRRRIDFLFAGDARNLARVIVRTGGRGGGDRAAMRLPRNVDDCAALARLARKLRPLRKGRRVVTRRLRAISRRRAGCGAATLPVAPAPAPAPGPAPVFVAPTAAFGLADGLTPDDPLTAGAAARFADASQGSELVSWTWDFGDGASSSERVVDHAFAAPGRYTVLLTVRNSRGQISAFGREVFVRAPGTREATVSTGVDCPGPGETVTVTAAVRVPSWARFPIGVDYSLPECAGADVSNTRELALAPGAAGDPLDAWGRPESIVSFEFDVSDGTGSGAANPDVIVIWS
jgi:hypothetical protein